MCWHMIPCDPFASCDLITVSDCVTAARGRLDDLLARMMRCELDDFEIVSKPTLDHVMLNCPRALIVLQFLRVVYKGVATYTVCSCNVITDCGISYGIGCICGLFYSW